MKNLTIAGAVAALGLLAAVPAQATSLTADQVTADNIFTAYVATQADNSDGVLVAGPDSDWTTFAGFSTSLTAGVTNYLNIAVQNIPNGQSFTGGNPGALIGRFLLDDDNFAFANGLQELLTDTENWVVSDTGFGVDPETPVSVGVNDGSFIWNTNANGGNPFTQVPEAAQFIWSDNQCTDCTVYFTAAISPADTPEPGSFAILCAGLLGMGVVVRQRRAARA